MKTKNQTTTGIRPTLMAMLISAICISSLTLLNPQIAQGKISVKAIGPKIVKELAPLDTIRTKKVRKVKKVAVKAKKGITYYQNGNYNNNPGMIDPKLEKLSKEVERHGNAIGKYYDSPEFKAKTEEIDRLSKQVNDFYNNPQIKEANAQQQKAASEYEKSWGEKSSKMEEIGKQMSAAGDVMNKYYSSKEFKDLNAKIAQKYNVPVDRTFSYNVKDENFLKYQAELKKNIPANILQQQDLMTDLGKQMREYTAGPDTKKMQEAMREAGENMRKAYNSPDVKATQEKMRKLGTEMRTYADNPDIKKEKDELHTATEKLREYTTSPEFKKKVEEYRKTHSNND